MPIELLGVMIPIIAIVMGISLGFYGVWTQHKQKLLKLQVELAKASPAGDGEQERELRELRERVHVLERIVTDGSYDLASRIDALRDERIAEPRQLQREPEARV